jgi:GR25 family glycosyltransferase involved in LPS biosynthesis
MPAVKSSEKYLGCALSHINCVRSSFALYPTLSHCIVLEDDVKPVVSRDSFYTFIDGLVSSQDKRMQDLDCLSINPTFDRDVEKNDWFSYAKDLLTGTEVFLVDPSLKLISGSSFMIYSKRVLERLDEYQDHLNSSLLRIPNDRLFTSREYAFFSFTPFSCAIPPHQMCALSEYARNSDNGGMGAYIEKNNLVILVHQSKLEHSTKSAETIGYEGKKSSGKQLSIRLLPQYRAILYASVIFILFVALSRGHSSSFSS